ncbi:hypothetical protein DOZ80_06660 [Pseudomonas fluorescens]|uniref:Uncharacterized protein n=1 Tax=Pseudomonas fluorescens TaxID=294 RepID=A0A327N8L3_PSEFL|nr:hypothetical protein [Pseudomonas fluorescens]RAI71511.1 hypothetical protein DOZ80_06660 [Pseudomonas fluorescens]
MSKVQSIAELLGVFPCLAIGRRRRRLNREEMKLVVRYRELAEGDRIAMRYLVDAMRSVSRF